MLKARRTRKGRFIKKKELERRSQLHENLVKKQNAEGNQNEDEIICNENNEEGTPCDSLPISWKDGRRIVELETLANNLICDCGYHLELRNINSECRKGLASYLYIPCSSCGKMNRVATGKMHYDPCKKKTNPVFSINSKAAIGMYHCGMGPTHVNSFLASMEIPGMSPTNMKKREREVTQKIHSIARTSCDEALVAETKASQPLNRVLPSETSGLDLETPNLVDVERPGQALELPTPPEFATPGQALETPDPPEFVTPGPSLELPSPPELATSGLALETPDPPEFVTPGPSLELPSPPELATPGQELMLPSPEIGAEAPSIKAKYDMGWGKRGSGRRYNSLSGVGTMMGNEEGKIIDYDVRNKDCRICSFWQNKGQTPPPHNCQKNWTGSSKAMEADVAGNLVNNIENKGITIDTIIMDDDTTSMARIRKELSHDIEKWSDLNHVKRQLGNKLFALAKKHKSLTADIIYFIQTKCFMYAIRQNEGDVDGVRAAILNIVPHLFGDHDDCGSWCGYAADPENYKHKTIDGDLVGEEFRKDMDNIFAVFAANSAKIAPCGSTQAVESFNHMVTTKAPKSRHYAGSESHRARVDCAVSQKNLGHNYVNKVNEECGLSPGKIFGMHASKQNLKRTKLKDYRSSTAYKKRRVQRKLNMSGSDKAAEVREGTTYQSAIDMEPPTSLDNIEIPPPLCPPANTKVNLSNVNNVFFDLETTSLALDCDITQIAARHGSEEFSQYILPNKAISPAATELTGLVVKAGTLYYHSKPVDSVGLTAGLHRFLLWLENKAPVLLIAHNARVFDSRRLMSSISKCALKQPFLETVAGFSDTLPIMQGKYPDMASHKQKDLVSGLLNEEYNAHNAEADVRLLQKLAQKAEIATQQLLENSFTTQHCLDMQKFDKERKENAATLFILVESCVLKKGMMEKMAASGLTYTHLRAAHSRAGRKGLSNILTEKGQNGKVRVTKNAKIIDSILSHFEK